MKSSFNTALASPAALAWGGALSLAASIGFGRFLYTPALPYMFADGQLRPGTAGLVAAVNFLGYLAGALAASNKSARKQPRAWLVGALAISAITTLMMGWSGSIPSFVILRFIGGVASAFVFVLGAFLILERLAKTARPKLIALHFAGPGLGIMASAVIVELIARSGGDWRMMWIVAGLLSLAMVPPVMLLMPRDAPVSAGASVAAPSTPMPRAALLLIAAYTLFGFGYVITATFLTLIVRETPGLSVLEGPLWFTLGLAGIVSMPFWSAMGARFGQIVIYSIICLVMAVAIATSVLSSAPAALFIAAILLGGTLVGGTALGLAAVRNLSAGEPQRMLALMTAAFGVGQIIGPLAAGALREVTGSFLLPSLIAASSLVIAAALGFAAQRAARI